LGVAAAGCRRQDRVGHVAVRQQIVHADDGDRLRHVPVPGRERQAGRRGGAFGGIAGTQANRHVRRRLAGQLDGERGLGRRPPSSAARRSESARPGRIVVRDLGRHPGDRQSLIEPVAADRRVVRWPLCEPSTSGSSTARDRHRLWGTPGAGRERQARGADTQLAVRSDRQHHVRRGLRRQDHRVRVRSPALGHLRRSRRSRPASPRPCRCPDSSRTRRPGSARCSWRRRCWLPPSDRL